MFADPPALVVSSPSFNGPVRRDPRRHPETESPQSINSSPLVNVRHWSRPNHNLKSLVFACLLLTFLPYGCARSKGEIKVNTEIEIPSLLVSEVLQARAESRKSQCPVELTNTGSKDRVVKIVRTGCACYGVTLDGTRLKSGDSFTIPAGETKQIQLEFQPADSQSEKHYTVDLTALLDNGKEQIIPIKCRQQVYSDIRITPSVVTVETEENAEINDTQAIGIEHVYRNGMNEEGALAFQTLPEHMVVSSLKKVGSAEDLGHGLWRQKWVAQVNVKLPATRDETPKQAMFSLAAESPDGEVTARQNGSLVIHTRQKVIFPNRVHFGKMGVGHTRTRRILLSSTESNFFRLTCDPSKLPPFIKVNIQEHIDDRHLVEISVTPTVAGRFFEELKFQTDMYDVTEIAVRIEGIAEEMKSGAPRIDRGTPDLGPEFHTATKSSE